MSVEKAIVYLLSNDADVNATVGSRIFPIFVPQGEDLPAITFQQISGVRDPHMKGASGLVESRFQINCWCKEYLDARNLANYVRIALSPESDDYPKSVNGTTISAIILLNENDVPSTYGDNEEMSGHGKMLDFNIAFQE